MFIQVVFHTLFLKFKAIDKEIRLFAHLIINSSELKIHYDKETMASPTEKGLLNTIGCLNRVLILLFHLCLPAVRLYHLFHQHSSNLSWMRFLSFLKNTLIKEKKVKIPLEQIKQWKNIASGRVFFIVGDTRFNYHSQWIFVSLRNLFTL